MERLGAARKPQQGCRDDEAHMKIERLDKRLKAMEETHTTVLDMAQTVDKISKRIKQWAPIIATAAISSGVVSGKWGAFLNALFTGHG